MLPSLCLTPCFRKTSFAFWQRNRKKESSFDVSAKAITWRAKECRYGGGKGNIQPLAQTQKIPWRVTPTDWKRDRDNNEWRVLSYWVQAMRPGYILFELDGCNEARVSHSFPKKWCSCRIFQVSVYIYIYIYTYVRCMSVENWQLNGNNTFWILQMNLH